MMPLSHEPTDGSTAPGSDSVPPTEHAAATTSSAPAEKQEAPPSDSNSPVEQHGSQPARRIKIGSQRRPDEMVQAKRQTTPISVSAPSPEVQAAQSGPPAPASAAEETAHTAAEPAESPGISPPGSVPSPAEHQAVEQTATDQNIPPAEQRSKRDTQRNIDAAPRNVPLPNLRAEMPADWEQEVEAALGGMSVDDLIDQSAAAAAKSELAPETKVKGRIVSQHRDNVFVDLGQRYQGVLSLRQFAEPPENGALIDVQVVRFEPEEGLYQLTLPGAAVDVGNWSDVTEGMVVQARVTGHNKGGLECEVNSLRGFIPASQVSLYRIEDLSTCVGESWPCVVTEANPEKRNLVLSRRAVLERESAEARTALLSELQPGAVRDGVVRRVQDFGVFVDLGGVDGLIHVSQLAWNRVKHPSEVVNVGDRVTVRVQKIDAESGKISLSMKELADNPWNTAAARYTAKSTHRGKVSKLMDFGAFVELEPGVEGLIHISELDHKRVFRVKDVVSEGDEVDVQVLSVDVPSRRISLSRKALLARAEPIRPAEPDEPESAPLPPRKAPKVPLKGGRGTSSGGQQFGLKW